MRIDSGDPSKPDRLARTTTGRFPLAALIARAALREPIGNRVPEVQFSGPSVVQTRIAELLAEGWSPAFNVTFNELAQDEHILQTAFAQYNVNTWRQFGADDPAADNVWLLCRTIAGISLNWPRSCDEARDDLLLQAQATDDQVVRADLYQQATQLIADQYLYVYFNHTLWNLAFADYVRGVCDRTSPEGEALKCQTNGRTWFDSTWIDG